MKTILRYRLEFIVGAGIVLIIIIPILSSLSGLRIPSGGMLYGLLAAACLALGKEHSDIVGILKITPVSQIEIIKYEYYYQIAVSIIGFAALNTAAVIARELGVNINLFENFSEMTAVIVLSIGALSIYNVVLCYNNFGNAKFRNAKLGFAVFFSLTISVMIFIISVNSFGAPGGVMFVIGVIIMYISSYFIVIRKCCEPMKNSEVIKL